MLILWYSRVRVFPQKRIEEDYLTKKKNNYCWVLPSCNILFFVLQFLCNILTHVSQAKRQKKFVQIPVFFPLLLLRATAPQKHHRPVGLLYSFPQHCKITVWKRLHKVKWTSYYSKHTPTVKANIITGRLEGMKDLVNGLVIKNHWTNSSVWGNSKVVLTLKIRMKSENSFPCEAFNKTWRS